MNSLRLIFGQWQRTESMEIFDDSKLQHLRWLWHFEVEVFTMHEHYSIQHYNDKKSNMNPWNVHKVDAVIESNLIHVNIFFPFSVPWLTCALQYVLLSRFASRSPLQPVRAILNFHGWLILLRAFTFCDVSIQSYLHSGFFHRFIKVSFIAIMFNRKLRVLMMRSIHKGDMHRNEPTKVCVNFS